ncbi:hypothetical protein [Variovorax sp. RA8]|uniref:hypothetical protein n=1 Tax=Variovorax sp. (strain JCM 16519 / RA8) TaxID=662548 RepID=UPI0013A53C0E|nr:hypothetical protein [Variovorax sp. RA8]
MLAMFACLHAQAADPPKLGDIPGSWARFQVSDFKGDKAMVAQIERADWWKNCAAWGVEARKKGTTRRRLALQYFLDEQKYINNLDLASVHGKVPEIGMTTCGAYALLGLPNAVNVTKGSYGTHVQHVWSDRRVYVYTRSKNDEGNALVSSVQY